jgi:NAD(P)-dependent dehydrogenase (short-subunit alcohol dehydrogenase family)
MYNPYSLKGKTILITGASSGIGRSAAIECSKMGANVIITARNGTKLSQVMNELEGGSHRMVLCDLSNEADINKMVEELPEVQGLINNAGYTKILPVQFINTEAINDIFQVNTVAPMLLLQKLLKKKKIKKGASVVFTSSLAGLGCCTVGNSMYSATKGAISAFIRCVALELAPKNIRVNAVCPAMVDTGILSSGTITEEQLSIELNNYPLRRFGKPTDIALAMVYLLSDAASWVTGDNLVIDGGLTLK